MRANFVDQMSDSSLLADLETSVGVERTATSGVLLRIGAVDARRLHRSLGYASMFTFCVGHLHLSEGAAYKRIQAARCARKFPVLFDALEDGRLHLSAVCLLKPHLTFENVDELIEASTHKSKAEVEELMARRFPQADVGSERPTIRALPARPSPQLSPGTDDRPAPDLLSAMASKAVDPDPIDVGDPELELSPGTVDTAPPAPPPVAIEPPPAERFLLKLTIDRATHDKLREFQALMRHAVPSGDVAEVLERALDLAIAQAKRAKCADRKPRRSKAVAPKGRAIPAHVRREVWERDQGRCTFLGDRGRRCDAREFVEFDHIVPVARGGRATVDGVRLRCRAHNQLEAERVFGMEFMQRKRG